MNLRKIYLEVKKKFKSKSLVLPSWAFYYIPLAFVITTLSGLVYLTGQQNLRQAANDPQIQISEDVANSLAAGTPPEQIIPNYSFDISKSLSTFVIVLDEDKKTLASTALLDDKSPEIPGEVFDFAKVHGQNRITWEPKEGVRHAIVITHFSGQKSGFVVTGRSLREVEIRKNALTKQIVLIFIFGIAGSLVTSYVLVERKK